MMAIRHQRLPHSEKLHSNAYNDDVSLSAFDLLELNGHEICKQPLRGILPDHWNDGRDSAFNREEDDLMSRNPISGLVCTIFLTFLGCPAATQEPARKAADAESGQLTFNNACRTCHTTKEGDNRLGPNLHNIIGRKAGSLPNYGYSSAMKGTDFVWDKQKLDRFIANPDEIVPGNNMKPYGGLTSAEDRARVIEFLESGRN